MTTLLQIGFPQVITQNIIYALPARRVLMFVEDGATFAQSNEVGFTVTVAVTLSGGQAELAGGFLKCTSSTPAPVTLKAF